MPEITPIETTPTTPTEEVIIKCCNCNDIITEYEEHDGETYCEDCFRDYFICCEQCGEYQDNDNTINVPDVGFYCSTRCANRAGNYECADCGDWHDNNEYRNAEGDEVCTSCSENYYCCDNCGDIVHRDNVHRMNSGDYYCGSCYEDEEQEEDDSVIHSYEYKPRFVLDKMPWENTIYLGIELEIECPSGKSVESYAEKVLVWLDKQGVKDRVYLKEDGSLKNGFEIVFQPATLQAIHKRFPMRSFLAYLKHLGLTSHEHGTCGLHVHISKEGLTDKHLLSGKTFFWKCKWQLAKFSARETFSYCRFDTDRPVTAYKQENGRYSAFNTCASDSTVEIRVFRGTLKYDRFLASLQFSDLFGEYIQTVSAVFLGGTNHWMIWDNFKDYAKTKGKYQQFLKYCAMKGL